MKISILLAMILFPAFALAVPDVTGVGDVGGGAVVFADSTTVYVTGSSFGTKTTAAPLVWSNWEEGTDGVAIHTVNPDWYDKVGNTVSYYGAQAARTGNFGAWNLGAPVSGFYAQNCIFAETDEVFMTYWFKYDYTISQSLQLRTVKHARILDSSGIGGESWYSGAGQVEYDRSPQMNSLDQIKLEMGYWPDTVDEVDGFCYIPYPNPGWFRVMLYAKLSTAGVANGRLMGSVNNSDRDYPNTMTRASGYSFRYDTVWMGIGGTGATGKSIYLDDMYIDNTLSRVELGNHSTYAASDQREMQIPSSWTTTKIGFLINAGTFVNDDLAYLYVFDSNGDCNAAGFPVTIAGVTDIPDPVPTTITRPDNLQVVE